MTTTQHTETAQRIWDHDVASTILAQIPFRLRMALGIRDRFIIKEGLRFTCTGTRTVKIDITLTAYDTYALVAYTERRKKGEVLPTKTIRYIATDLYAEQMVQVLDMMDRGQIEL